MNAEETHHGTGDHSGKKKAEPEGAGEGDVDTGAFPNAVSQGIQDITGDDIFLQAAGVERLSGIREIYRMPNK